GERSARRPPPRPRPGRAPRPAPGRRNRAPARGWPRATRAPGPSGPRAGPAVAGRVPRAGPAGSPRARGPARPPPGLPGWEPRNQGCRRRGCARSRPCRRENSTGGKGPSKTPTPHPEMGRRAVTGEDPGSRLVGDDEPALADVGVVPGVVDHDRLEEVLAIRELR